MYRSLLNGGCLRVVGEEEEEEEEDVETKKLWMSPSANESQHDLPRAMVKHDNLCAILAHHHNTTSTLGESRYCQPKLIIFFFPQHILCGHSNDKYIFHISSGEHGSILRSN